jgi:hypothetical protein
MRHYGVFHDLSERVIVQVRFLQPFPQAAPGDHALQPAAFVHHRIEILAALRMVRVQGAAHLFQRVTGPKRHQIGSHGLTRR